MSISNEKEMGIWDHIAELRGRLLKAILALMLATLGSFYFTQYLIEYLAVPVGGLNRLLSIEVTENVGVFMRVSLLAGFIIALPIMLFQILAFVMPGLYPNERRWLMLSIPLATVLFVVGVAFAYYVMLPAAIPFLVSFLGVPTTPRLANYIEFVTNLMFWIGVAFETPLVVYLLAKLHIVTAGMLLRQWRIAIVIIALLAAMITPTVDPVNMALLMAPLFAIYLLSCLFAWFAQGRQKPG